MSGKLWEYGGYWLAQTQGSDVYYACWYDAGRRRTRRRTLGTKVFEDAQKELISLAGAAKSESSRAPDKVMILAALDHYYENDVSGKPSAD